MFNTHYLKFQPSEYVLRYKKGKLIAEGAGLTFLCYAPTTSVAVLPVGSIDTPFIFEETTADFQGVTIQGQLMFRIADQKKTANMLNYTLNLKSRSYLSEDPRKLPQRMINNVKVLARKQLERLSLHEAMGSGDILAKTILEGLSEGEEIRSLGIEILGLSILSILPGKETSRALEAQTREQILGTADDAVYERRNASIDQERKVKENEFNTEISVETKKRQVQETQLEAKQAVQFKENQLKEEDLRYQIKLEEMRKELVKLAAENAKAEADAKAYTLSAVMKALDGVNPSVIQSLTTIGMQPDKLMAMAFQGIAENAAKIGQLNITPDLLREITQQGDVRYVEDIR